MVKILPVDLPVKPWPAGIMSLRSRGWRRRSRRT